MEGVVKKINRSVWFFDGPNSHHTTDDHSTRQTCTYVVLDNGDKVILEESEILSCYGRQRITETLIYDVLGKSLVGKNVSYAKGSNGDYYLDGPLSQYL